MRSRVLTSILAFAALTAVAGLSGCAAEPTEERAAPEATAVTVPECTPAAKDSPGECAANGDSDALLKKYIGQCPFSADAVSEDWTEDFGWIWWNPATPGTTAALGVEIDTGNALCT
jgi:hypothetical protein